jgi:hypothetical protein
MSHRADQIVDRVVEILQDFPDLDIPSQNIFAHRTLSLSEEDGELPAATVNEGEDSPVSEIGTDNLAFIDSVLAIAVRTLARARTEAEIRRVLGDHRRFVHKALMVDQSLGLPFVIGIRYGGATAAEIDTESELASGARTSIWGVHYRMNITDPGD